MTGAHKENSSSLQVYKFPIHSCSVHKDCGDCLKSKDPLGCGWCVDSCTTKIECPKIWTDPFSDVTPSCPPILYSVSAAFHYNYT